MSTVRLPLGYRRVDYILNSNNTYINTGIYLSSDDHVILEYDASMASGAGNRYLFGDDTTAGKRFFALSYYSGSASPRFGYAAISTRYLTGGRIEVLNHVWSFGGTEDTYDGTYNGNVQNFVCTQPCCLFNNPSKANAKHDFGISHFFVEGKFDGYACINPDGEAGIYDIQSQSFLKSPEGIAFVAGPVIEEEGFFQFGDSRRRMMMGYPIYIPAADLITMGALIQNGKTPVMSALDKNTVNVTTSLALYAKDFNSRLSDSRFIQLLPNHTYTIIVTSSAAMSNWNYIITYEAWQAVVGTTTAPANKRFKSGGGTSYQTTVTTGASGKLFIFVGGTKTQFKVQIK